jgi:hypothetical protein
MQATVVYSALAKHLDFTLDLGGRIYPEQAPPTSALPFVVVRTVSAERLDAYDIEGADVLVLLELFGRGYHESAAIADSIAGAIRDDLLTLDSGVCYHVNQVSEPTPQLRSVDEYGDDVWQWTVTYQFGVQ